MFVPTRLLTSTTRREGGGGKMRTGIMERKRRMVQRNLEKLKEICTEGMALVRELERNLLAGYPTGMLVYEKSYCVMKVTANIFVKRNLFD